MGLELILIAALALGVGAAFTGDAGYVPEDPDSKPDASPDESDTKTEGKDSFDHTNDLVNADDGPTAWDGIAKGEMRVQNPPATQFAVKLDDPDQDRKPVVPLGRTVLSLYPTDEALDDIGEASSQELRDVAKSFTGTTRSADDAPLVKFAGALFTQDDLTDAEKSVVNVDIDSLPQADRTAAAEAKAEALLTKLSTLARTDPGVVRITTALNELQGVDSAEVRLQIVQVATKVTDAADLPSDLRQAIADRTALQRDADTYNLYFREAGTALTVRDIPDIFQTADGGFGADVTDTNGDGQVNALDAVATRLDGNLSDIAKRMDINTVKLGAQQDSATLRPDEAHVSADKWREGNTPTHLIKLGDGDDRVTFGTGVAVDPGKGTDLMTLRVEADTYTGGVGTQRSGSDYYTGANVNFSDPKDKIVIDFESSGDQYVHLVQVSETVQLEYGQATQVRLDVWVSDQRVLPSGTFESIYLGPANDGVVPVVQKLVGLNLGYSSVAAVDPYADSPLDGVNEGQIRQWQVGRDIFIDRTVVGGTNGSNVVNITV